LHSLGAGAVARPPRTIAILQRRAADYLHDPEFAANDCARLERGDRIFDLRRNRLRQSLAAAVTELGVVGSCLAALGARNHQSWPLGQLALSKLQFSTAEHYLV